MELFVRIVRAGTLAGAARDLSRSPASVTARLKALERHYGVTLLTRTTRTSVLTDAGRDFFDACVAILAEVEEAGTRLRGHADFFRGPLRITAPSDIGQQHVAPVLSRFIASHPDVTPYLHLSDGVQGVVAEGFDMAIRYGELANSSLQAQRLARTRRIVCASPEYLARAGTPKHPADLKEHACISMMWANEIGARWHFSNGTNPENVRFQPARTTNDGALARRWAIEGVGIVLKARLDVLEELRQGRLVTLLETYTVDYQRPRKNGVLDLHVLHSGRKRRLPQRVAAFVEALKEHFQTIMMRAD